MSEPIKAVALGGGHGLHASLTALRLLTTDLTAVVTVADDGGSSGRIRHELDVLPPGDLRMALVALAGEQPAHRAWAELLQHRLGGEGVLAGHPVGNLILTGLLEHGDEGPVPALARVAELVGAVGAVLPMSPVPLNLVAEVDRFDPEDPARTRSIRGSSASILAIVSSMLLSPSGGLGVTTGCGAPLGNAPNCVKNETMSCSTGARHRHIAPSANSGSMWPILS